MSDGAHYVEHAKTNTRAVYPGVGQAYADLISFEPDKIAHEIMS